ncbi:glycoprotein [Chinese mitten crab virus 1]|uniref:Envelopment polyprotein n=1 Tax=Chinese mitten crab virus 1 TaxID=2849698 RepID=A0A482IF50_9VIRU|nr:glycoprotein [Chinese mitten crab virus 1]QBP05471.1 glycoprotein [Chinese mitten crab virus 1]
MYLQQLLAVLSLLAFNQTWASIVCSTNDPDNPIRTKCPDNLPGICRHVITTLDTQIYLHQNNTYVMTDEPNSFCDPYQAPWTRTTYQVADVDTIGNVMAYQTCQAAPERRFGLFQICPVFVTLTGDCTYKSINKHQFELSTSNRIVAIEMHGAINHRTTLLNTQVFTIPSITIGNNIVYINCGKNSWAMKIIEDPMDTCVHKYTEIYQYDFIAQLRCRHPVWFFTVIVVVVMLAVNKALIWTGLDSIVYPLYAALLAVLYQPILYVSRRMFGCKYCHKTAFIFHRCALICCGTNHYTKENLQQHKLTSQCCDYDTIYHAKYISRSFIPRTLNLILCVLILVILLPVSSAYTCNGTSVSGGHRIPNCGVSISSTSCGIVESFYPDFTCQNLQFFGLIPGTNQIPNARHKRSVIIDHPAFQTDLPRVKIDKRYAEPVSVQDAVITSTLLSGFLEVDLPGQLGESRMFKIQEEGMLAPTYVTVSIAEAKCAHAVEKIYSTCDTQISVGDLQESCTGPTGDCSSNITDGVPAVRKIWPQVQNWGCEEPGCLSIYTGCLGATCTSNAKSDCADVLRVSNPQCEIKVCVTIHNKHECQVLERDVEKGSIYATWTYQEPSRIIATNTYALYKDKLLSGPINDLGEFDFKFGSYQIVSPDITYFLGEPSASYQCHAVAYKDVTFNKCVRDTFHLSRALQHVQGLYISPNRKSLYEQDLLLGVVTIRHKLRGLLINELEITSSISLGAAKCIGHSGHLKGVNCTISVTSDSIGIAHLACEDLHISDGKVTVHPGHSVLSWFGFTDNVGHNVDNCTFKFRTRTLPFKATIDSTPLAALNLLTEPYFASQTAHNQAPCSIFICTIWTSIEDFFTGVFNTASIITGVIVVVLMVFALYIVVYGSIKAYHSFKQSYTAASKDYLKTA